jgi:hypothetical protein
MDTNLYENKVFDDPARRRLWLLIKALEAAPLREALVLARGAEAFLTGGADSSQEKAVADYLTAFQLPSWMH